jgi:hypothetical protein
MAATASDGFSANPFPANSPKYFEFEELRKREHRAAVQSRFTHSFKLRVADYNAHVTSSSTAVAPSRSSSPQSANFHAPRAAVQQPPAPQVSVKFANAVGAGADGAAAACAVTLHGGSTVWVGHVNGTVSVRKGLDGSESASFTVHRVVDAATPFRRDVMAALDGKEAPKRKTTKSDETTDAPGSKKGDEASAAAGVSALAEVSASLVAVGLTDGRLLLWNSLNLLPVASATSRASPNETSAPLSPVSAILVLKDASIITVTGGGLATRWALKQATEEDGTSTIEAIQTGRRNHNQHLMVCAAKATVIAATKDGVLSRFDRDDLGLVKFGSVQGSPSCIAVSGDILAVAVGSSVTFFSLARDVVLGHREKVTPTDIIAAIPDTLGNRFWFVGSDGNAVEVDADSRTHFASRLQAQTIQQPTDGEEKNKQEQGKEEDPAKVLHAHLYAHADALRLWTLASNGLNAVWWTELFRAQCEAFDAAEDMRVALARDEGLLHDAKELIEARVDIVERRRRGAGATVGSAVEANLLRQYYHVLRRFRLRRQYTKKRPAVATALEAKSNQSVAQGAYFTWVRNARVARHRKEQDAAAKYLEQRAAKVLRVSAFRRWAGFVHATKIRAELLRRVSSLEVAANARVVARYFEGVARFSLRRRDLKRKATAVTLMGQQAAIVLTCRYMQMWARCRAVRLHQHTVARAVASTLKFNDSALLARSYARFAANVRRVKNIKMHALWGGKAESQSLHQISSRYFSSWSNFSSTKKAQRGIAAADEAQARLQETEKQYDAAKARIDKLERLRGLQQRLKDATAKADELRRTYETERGPKVEQTCHAF